MASFLMKNLMAKAESIIGQKFGNLLVLRQEQNDKTNHAQWLCQCDCGNKKVIKGSYLKIGRTKSCGCSTTNRLKKSPGFVSFNHKFNLYKTTAKRRKIKFQLELNDFIRITSQSCFYCGDIPKTYNVYDYTKCASKETYEKGQISINGIDRIDSKVGYTVENCVPCCMNCNYAKNALTTEDFKTHILKIYNHFCLKEG